MTDYDRLLEKYNRERALNEMLAAERQKNETNTKLKRLAFIWDCIKGVRT